MAWYSGVSKALQSLFGGNRTPAPPTQPNGGDGVQAYGGWLASDERNPALVGLSKWRHFANAHHTAIVATGLRYRCNLLAAAEWHAEPNPRGGRDADRAVDIVTQGLLTAQLDRPWQSCVRKASMFQANGFSLFEWSIKRRDDGMIVFSDIGHRPPHTIQRWDKPSEQMPWQAVAQLSRQGNEYIIPRNRLWYCWDDTLTDLPDGVGLLRHVIELVRRLGVLEGLEGLAYETDVRGMPIGRAPIRELRDRAALEPGIGTDKDKINAFLADRTASLRAQLEGVVKSPEKLQWLLLDSDTYRSADQQTVSSIQKWAFELLQGNAKGLQELNTVIGRLQLEIARVFGIEFVMMGASRSGSQAMHADKTSMLAASLQAALSEIATSGTRDLARPLVALNGLDPDTCTPTLVAEPIDRNDVMQVAQTLLYLSQAGLQPDDPAIDVIRAWSGLPDAPEPDPAMMGVLGARPGGKRPGAGPPDPNAGEVDVQVDDLGPEGKPVTKYAPDQARDEGGRFASDGGGSGGGRAWTRAFDSRDHQRQIDEHRAAEDYHRGEAGKLSEQIRSAQGRMRDATPARQEKIQGKIDRLTAQRDEHRVAASSARVERTKVRQDMEEQRSAHAAGLREQAAQRRAAAEARQQREAIGVVGTRIAGADEHMAAPASHPIQPAWIPTEEDTHDALNQAENERAKQSAALERQEAERAHADLVARLAAQQSSGIWRAGDEARMRQVVTPAEPTRTQSEWNEHDRQQREARSASDERAVARNEAGRPESGGELPRAETHSPRPGALGRLRGLLSRKGVNAEVIEEAMKAYEDRE